jgi:hypothetical protein
VKTSNLQYFIGLVFLFFIRNAIAQISPEQIRNSDTISYYVIAPFSSKAEFTWTITGGSIIGHSSPYTAIGADTIKVIWNNSNKNDANYGTLNVFERISWSGTDYCQSEETDIKVESWVRPAAIAEMSNINVCQGEPFTVSVRFQGKPGYNFKWKLYDKENPNILIEDHSTEFINCSYLSADINLNGINNSSDSLKYYVFEITDVQDGLNDNLSADLSMGKIIIGVQPIPNIGIPQSNKKLIRRL